MKNPLLQGLARTMRSKANLHHEWTAGLESYCRLCGQTEMAAEIAELCMYRIEQLMVDFAEEAHKQGRLNVS